VHNANRLCTVSPRECLGDELAGEPLELGPDLPSGELGELGAVLPERAGDDVGESTVEHLSGCDSECARASGRVAWQRKWQRTGVEPCYATLRALAGFG
jgi:hypothetical protein